MARTLAAGNVSPLRALARWALLISLCAPLLARAGAQSEETLADAVRTALAAQVADRAPPEPQFSHYAEKLAYLKWLGEMGNRLAKRKADYQTRQELLRTVWYEARRAGLDAGLVLGLIEVESGFRKHVVSLAGARGYMQVMPFWVRQLTNDDPRMLFDLRVNLRYGCTILRYYLDREQGDLYYALGRYNGSRGQPQYPNAVMGAARRWQMPATPVS
jgi:soluble lytic murein transglycosylase-like protein